jgi:hypothetical protein
MSGNESSFAYTSLAIRVLQEAAEKKYVEESQKTEEDLIEKCLVETSDGIEEADENQLRAAVLQMYTGDLSIYVSDEEIKAEELKERLEALIDGEGED